MNNLSEIKKKFDDLYAEWQEVIQSPRIQASSNPEDYNNNKPYREIIRLGKDVLPLVLEKIKDGVFFMNKAALVISETDMKSLIDNENKMPVGKRIDFMKIEKSQFLSEQQKSEIILKHIAVLSID